MNEPQLSAEGKLNILELVDPKVPYSHFVRVLEKYTQEVIATALEEERAKVLSEVEKMAGDTYDGSDWHTGRHALVDELRTKLNQMKGNHE